MKVVHLISSFGAGGAELLVKDIAIHTDTEIIVEVWAAGVTNDKEFEEKYIQELSSHNIVGLKLGKIAGKNKLKIIWKLRRLLKERKPDVINAHSELVALYAAVASLGLKTNVVQTIHNTVITYPFLEKYVTGKIVKKLVAISERCHRLIEDKISRDQNKIKLIYNGINIQKFQLGERIIKKEVCNIMSIGRLDVQKDHSTLLKAFSILVEKLNKAEIAIPNLNIIGSGILKNELEVLSNNLKVAKYTNFMGVRNDIPELLYKNDLWVMSSRWEGLSIALMEALASGIPVIATNVGSNDELIESGINGILIGKESPDELAETMLKVIQNYELRMSVSENAKKRIVEFNISQCTKGYQHLYNELVNYRAGSIQVKGSNTQVSKTMQSIK